jgi:hypothetical protein
VLRRGPLGLNGKKTMGRRLERANGGLEVASDARIGEEGTEERNSRAYQ